MKVALNVLLALSVMLSSAGRLQASDDAWIEKVMAWTIDGYFQKAEDFLNERIARTDSAISPCFYLASVLNSKMTHFENIDDAGKFEHLLTYIIKKSNERLEQKDLSDSALAKYYFYRGSAYGYLAYFQGQNGRWVKALENGIKAIKDLTACTEIDSAMYEAYLGLGTYKYWRSTKLKFVLWLPFLADQREEGIADIKRALRSSSNSRYMAMHQLIYILIDYKHYDEALQYAREAIAHFPESQFMWWAYAHVYYKRHDYPQAVKAYQHLLKLIERHPESNPSHWLDCQLRIAELYRRMGQNDLARRAAEKIWQKRSEFPETEKNRKRLARAERLLQELNEGQF
ncbi:tetratricopeptide repeat protein [Caldithrix abyssi]